MTNEELAVMIRSGVNVSENMAALYENNKGMIAALAWKFQAYAELEDLHQEGFIGLCHAVDAWDPEGGASFIHYASFWIRQTMQRYIENCGSCIRIPSGQQQQIRQYKKIIALCLKELGRKPSELELCRILNISQDNLHKLQESAIIEQIQSLSVPLGEDGDLSLEDVIPDPRDDYASILDEMQQEELSNTLWPIVDSLEEKQAQTLRARYREGKTLKETGKVLGCGLQQARAIETKALQQLRRRRYADRLRPFLYDDVIKSKGIQGTSAERFRQTWTSATERVALQEITTKWNYNGTKKPCRQ